MGRLVIFFLIVGSLVVVVVDCIQFDRQCEKRGGHVKRLSKSAKVCLDDDGNFLE